VENSSIEDTLDEATDLFERPGRTVEDGLDVDDPALLQLRKACRPIDAATFLSEQNGYYTVVIEASFAAIERTIQCYLLQQDLLHEDEYVDHEQVYERGVQAGLYNQEFAGKLDHLWRNNRSDTYYREGVATERRAEKMLELAEEIHTHVLQLGSRQHECVCSAG